MQPGPPLVSGYPHGRGALGGQRGRVERGQAGHVRHGEVGVELGVQGGVQRAGVGQEPRGAELWVEGGGGVQLGSAEVVVEGGWW